MKSKHDKFELALANHCTSGFLKSLASFASFWNSFLDINRDWKWRSPNITPFWRNQNQGGGRENWHPFVVNMDT